MLALRIEKKLNKLYFALVDIYLWCVLILKEKSIAYPEDKGIWFEKYLCMWQIICT